MKLFKIISISTLTIVLIFIVLAAAFIVTSGPTKGTAIQDYDAPQKALVIIDIQEDYTGKTAKPPFPYKNSKGLIDSVNRLIEETQQTNFIIIYIRQEFDGPVGRLIANTFAKGTAIKGNAGTEIDSRIKIVSNHIFGKPKGDSFSNPEFEQYLIDNRIDELYLAGIDAEFCIYHTALGALNRKYKVTIIKDAIAIRNEHKLQKMLGKYKDKGITLISVNEHVSKLNQTDFPNNSSM